ncbi:MAG: DUF3429 domain-containing protein [Alphaproteobacteria bacterium]
MRALFYPMVKTSITNVPSAPMLLGILALIPFMLPPVWVWSQGPSGIFTLEALIWHQSYAAVTLAFLGALHFAFDISAHKETPVSLSFDSLATSVLPAFTAWYCLQLNSSFVSLLLMAGAYVSLFLYDMYKVRRNPAIPRWFVTFKLPLTLVASCSLTLMAFL